MAAGIHEPESSSPSKHRRPAPRGELRREALLEAALSVFSQVGYAHASMKDIAKLAGVTAAGLLYHFPNKTALLNAVLDRKESEADQYFDQLNARTSLSGFIKSIRVIFRRSIETQMISQAFMMLNVESLGQLHPAHDRFQTWFKNVHSAIASYLESLIEEGEIRSTQTSVVAREICAVMDGTQLQWLRRPDDMDPVAQFDDYLSRLKVTLSP
ncbi:TetR/AcrR family transcriptional regulator [Pseudomonas savastanoi pv. phaseolicola]|uniref:Transcriptional regulator, TetR family n=1 Tax=Pseudomonas savastanoi pv. phaseolicola (strain 1448A / Race 6) TaxID=264730 RepID=Q48NH8_PSE14|nr:MULTISPECIES: TetR/AcrR family transcriptional regulator [Pseudomonas]AAZ33159.1 transcriptional regulator, TetR family [Pseudomonas savastanoi pv. phaseolicola 1448A]MBN4183883.1 HTH-type transcriptional regulator BetI [Pseudomonas savastanoi pv. phaseolicola]MDG6379824.1 TetR/AcrR family transcriptional regulator [Pseudomonas savastanoi pv. phaseolicola]MDG6390185.1 TetR/AcrR family transcriptional regulator [Pseudomonas savastanoi pv. phaseolicola]QDV99132.1 TetR/AcrR family transcriptio